MANDPVLRGAPRAVPTEAFLEAAPDAIVIVGVDGRIRTVNRLAEELFGFSREEMLGQPVEMLIPERFRKLHAIHRTQYSSEPRTRPMGTGQELLGRRRDGTEFPVEISLSPLHTEDETLVISIVRDISDRVRNEEERRRLLWERIRAEEISRAKDQFLMTLSHELKTPLTSILGWSNLLLIEGAAEPIRDGLEAIQKSAAAQARIIDDVLETSRMIAGKIRLHIALIDPIDVIQNALQTVRPGADAKSIRVLLDVGPDVGKIAADPGRLQQIVWNLLSNAIKFSEKGSTVTVRVEQRQSMLEIAVMDQGRGIDPSFLPYAFEPFLQADGSTTRAHGGLGLGLSIVRQLVELHGGSIVAESAGAGKGATFRVRLPIRSVAEAPPGEEMLQSTRRSLPNLRGLRVLYVDDDAESRAIISAILDRAGAKVELAGSVPAAISFLQVSLPNVIMTDIAMPAEDGYALARYVKTRFPNVPVIALTALTRSEEAPEARQVFDLFLRKPADPVTIAEAVEATSTGQRRSDN